MTPPRAEPNLAKTADDKSQTCINLFEICLAQAVYNAGVHRVGGEMEKRQTAGSKRLDVTSLATYRKNSPSCLLTIRRHYPPGRRMCHCLSLFLAEPQQPACLSQKICLA
jgi:hypothetical protein